MHKPEWMSLKSISSDTAIMFDISWLGNSRPEMAANAVVNSDERACLRTKGVTFG
jgi:hypothetical protein